MPAVRVNANPYKLDYDWFRDEYQREEVHQKIASMLERGYSQLAIAREVGVSDTAVRRMARRKGMLPKGGSKGSLNEDQVREIRAWFDTGNVSQAQLAEQYNVAPATIYSVVRRRTWKDVE